MYQSRKAIKCLLFFLTLFLCVSYLPNLANAQNRPPPLAELDSVKRRIDEGAWLRSVINADMDPVLEGDWDGRGSHQPGGRTDPLYIACMVERCAAVKATYPTNPERWRDNRFFGQCFKEHAARVKSKDFVPLPNPPPLTSLGCAKIHSLRQSQDQRIYQAVNGQADSKPATSNVSSVAKSEASKKPVPVTAAFASVGSVAAKAAQLKVPSSIGKSLAKGALQARPNRTAKKPTSSLEPKFMPRSAIRGFGDLGSRLELLYANDNEAAIRVLPQGQFYTIQASWLARDYFTDWETVYTEDGARAEQFIGACFEKNGSIVLDNERMKMGQWVEAARKKRPNMEFLEDCKDRDGEFRFALQAGQTIVLKAKGVDRDFRAATQKMAYTMASNTAEQKSKSLISDVIAQRMKLRILCPEKCEQSDAAQNQTDLFGSDGQYGVNLDMRLRPPSGLAVVLLDKNKFIRRPLLVTYDETTDGRSGWLPRLGEIENEYLPLLEILEKVNRATSSDVSALLHPFPK